MAKLGGGSPVLAAVRKRQMATPSPESKQKAAQAGGGKVFSHTSLAQHAGVKPEAIADLAHGSQHVHDFHQKVRQQFGDKVKHLTSRQIRSAYHSTGLMHSMPSENDMEKALSWKKTGSSTHVAEAPHGTYRVQSGAGLASTSHHELSFKPKGAKGFKPVSAVGFPSPKHAMRAASKHAVSATKSLTHDDLDIIKAHKHSKRCVIGHTSSGDAVHSDGYEAEGLDEAGHNEAAELHGDLSNKLSRAASQWPSMGGESKLPSAARKYLQGLADHHNHLAARHRETAYKHRSEQNKLSGGVLSGPTPVEPFGKSMRKPKGLEPFTSMTIGEHTAASPHGSYKVHEEGGKHHLSFAPRGAKAWTHVGVSGSKEDAFKMARAHHELHSASQKSMGVVLSNNPTDAEIAKAMMAGGGAGALSTSGLLAPMMRVQETMTFGLPAEGETVEISEAPKAEQKPKFQQTVGGNLSAAWDLGNYHE
jgi:hypothetical protein